jgi:hypothetical protein
MSEVEARLHALLLIELLTVLADEGDAQDFAVERPVRTPAVAA